MRQMTTVGIDLSVDPKNTGVCELRWDGEGATAAFPDSADDEALRAIMRDPGVDVVGIDVPLGWPEGFADAVDRYMDRPDGRWTTTGGGRFADSYFRLRETDRHAKSYAAEHGVRINPMSVSADKLGAPAMRAAWLLTTLAEDASTEPIDRSGVEGRVVEVYPAGAVAMWDLELGSYRSRAKGEEEAAVTKGFEQLRQRAGFPLRLADPIRTEHQLDAVLCALVARAARTDPPMTVPAPPELRDVAGREGWLHLPMAGSLPRLATG